MRGLAMLLVVLGFSGACACGSGLAADGEVTYAGSFVWEKKKGQTHPISGVFTPAGEKKWSVAFTFKWGGKGDLVWKGTAAGDLANGAVTGEVQTPDGKRKFNFAVTAKNGQLEGSHNEIIRAKPQSTGTITLKKK